MRFKMKVLSSRARPKRFVNARQMLQGSTYASASKPKSKRRGVCYKFVTGGAALGITIATIELRGWRERRGLPRGAKFDGFLGRVLQFRNAAHAERGCRRLTIAPSPPKRPRGFLL